MLAQFLTLSKPKRLTVRWPVISVLLTTDFPCTLIISAIFNPLCIFSVNHNSSLLLWILS
jgi:hypothetical protein